MVGSGSGAVGAFLFRERGAAGAADGRGGGLLAAESAASLAEERVTLEDMRFYLFEYGQGI